MFVFNQSPIFFLSFSPGDPSFIRSGWFNSIAGVVKRRFASYVKLHLAAGATSDSTNGKDSLQQHRERYDKQRTAAASSGGGGGGDCATMPSQLPLSKMQPPSPHVLSGIDRRHRSPDPPPRYFPFPFITFSIFI